MLNSNLAVHFKIDAKFSITDLLRDETQTRNFIERTFSLGPDIVGTLLELQVDSNQVVKSGPITYVWIV